MKRKNELAISRGNSLPRSFSLAIVGADHLNKRGPPRRFEIAMCRPGEPVELRPEPNNPADPRAIAVYSCRGIQLGYVRAERAQMIGSALNRYVVSAIFQQADPWGCTVRVAFNAEPELPDAKDPTIESDWPPPGSEDADWWPDEEWPDE